MKVCVYAIAKDEEKFVTRFMEAIGHDVDVFIGDTGSTDQTMELFEAYPNVQVKSIVVSPWRFDVARNTILASIPEEYDLYVSLDLDDVLDPGWHDKLISAPKANQYQYRYIWSHHPDGRPDIVHTSERIHSGGFTWKKRTHEVLIFTEGQPVVCYLDDFVIQHYPDTTKSRGFNLALLAAEYKESPTDPRNAFYYGRECYFVGQYRKAIKTLTEYLELPLATWGSERSAASQYLAKCYEALDNPSFAEFWYLKATLEATERESFIALAEFYCHQGNYRLALAASRRAYQIKHADGMTYTRAHYAWNGGPEHLMSYTLWQMGDRSLSKKYAIEAVMQDSHNAMFIENLTYYKEVPDA